MSASDGACLFAGGGRGGGSVRSITTGGSDFALAFASLALSAAATFE